MTSETGAGSADDVVVVGLGASGRHDDGVGPVVSARAAGLSRARDVGPVVDPLDLLGRWDGATLAVVIDAIRSGASPGTIRIVELDAAPAPAEGQGAAAGREQPGGPGAGAGSGSASEGRAPKATSSHGIGLVETLRLARAVGQAPARVVVVGIEGQDFSQGIGLSRPVRAALPAAVREVVRVVEEERPCA